MTARKTVAFSEPVLLIHDDRTYLCERGEELQTDLGVVQIPRDIEPGATLESHLGTAFRVRRPRGPDLFEHLERTGAPMLPRDVGLVIGLTGICGGDRVLDVGTGTGILALYLGRLGAAVTTYERDSEAAAVARSNMAKAGVAETVRVVNRDAMTDLERLREVERFDVMTLDTGDADELVREAPDLLVDGGYVAAYSPFIENVRSIVEAARADLESVETVETIQRAIEVEDRGTRPSPSGVGHSGYLTIARNRT